MAVVVFVVCFTLDTLLRLNLTNGQPMRVVHWTTKVKLASIQKDRLLKASPYGWWFASWFGPWEQTIWATTVHTAPKAGLETALTGVVGKYGVEFTVHPGERSFRVSKAFFSFVRVRVQGEGISIDDLARAIRIYDSFDNSVPQGTDPDASPRSLIAALRAKYCEFWQTSWKTKHLFAAFCSCVFLFIVSAILRVLIYIASSGTTSF